MYTDEKVRFGTIIRQFFKLVEKIEEYNIKSKNSFEHPSRIRYYDNKIKEFTKKLNLLEPDVISIIEQKITKKSLILLIKINEEFFKKFMNEKFDYNAWKKTIENALYLLLMTEDDFNILRDMIDVPRKYIHYVIENVSKKEKTRQ